MEREVILAYSLICAGFVSLVIFAFFLIHKANVTDKQFHYVMHGRKNLKRKKP